MDKPVVRETDLTGLEFVGRGKVRDVYCVDGYLLIVSSDRLSAFDVVLPDPIPEKGAVLNTLSLFWMEKTRHIVPNHLVTADVSAYPDPCKPFASVLNGRSMLVQRAEVFPVECVVRGYIIGSGWKDYQRTGMICGIPMPKGLKQAEKLPEPVFTPSTKAEIGAHDENITFAQVVDIVGAETAAWLRDKTLELYVFAARLAEERGIIIADTKFEFGLVDGIPTLVDEILTPDSSRFWPMSEYRAGMSPPSLDKQFVRDYLEGLDWDKKPPAPRLPVEIIARTSEKYREMYRIMTGRELA